MEIRKVPINKLNPAPYNPRKDLKPEDPEYQKLERSIEEFGYIDPIIWNETTGNVIGGHQRLKILTNKGHTEVEVSVVHMDDATEKAANVALNKISGDWDEAKLAEILQELSAEADVSLTGFDDDELEKLLNEASGTIEGEVSDRNNVGGGNFSYREQYGVIVICKDEAEQEQIYNSLSEQGYDCKVVAT